MDPHGWIPVVELEINIALKAAEGGAACCACDPQTDLGDVRDELVDAISHLQVAKNYISAAREDES